MNAQDLLHDLTARGVILSTDGDHLDVDGPADALTDELIDTLIARKAELLKLLAPSTSTTRPRPGSFARPMPARGSRMPPVCQWPACGGRLTGKGRDLYHCGKCGTWFKLVEPETGFVYVGDLADDFDAGDAAEWVM